MKKVICLWLVVCSLLLASCTHSANVPLPHQDQSLQTHTLPNGMTVTLKESHGTPLTTIQFWVHVGSRNEQDDTRGLAHVFEHIWFKGTATQPVGSFHKRVESLGGELNAMTSQDWTMFFVTVPSEHFDDIFPNMVDLLLHPAFNETEIDKELQVITEEQRFQYNEPERYVDQEYGLLLLDSHPYRHPIIGYKDTILAQNKTSIENFYHTWYAPNNINIVVAGDIKPNDVLRKISDAFVDFPRHELPQLSLPVETPSSTIKYNSTFREVGYVYATLGNIAPAALSPDKYPFIVLNTILSGGDSSRMTRIMKNDKQLIVRGNSVYAPFTDLGVFEALIVTEPDKHSQAMAELILQTSRFKTEPVTDEELARAKAVIKADKLRSQEEIFQTGFDIGEAWIRGDLADYTEFTSRVDAVTVADVQRVAQKYFTPYTIYEVKPKP